MKNYAYKTETSEGIDSLFELQICFKKLGYKNTDNNFLLFLFGFVDSKIEMKNVPLVYFLQNYSNIYVCPIDFLGLFTGCKFPI